MLTAAIYSSDVESVKTIKETIQNLIIENNLFAKISIFENKEELLTTPNSFDVYLMDIDEEDDILDLTNEMLQIDSGASTILFSHDIEKGYIASEKGVDYFLLKPIKPEALTVILKKIKNRIKIESIVIKTNQGERRIKTNNLNYINIESRCLCYHLKDSSLLDGTTLRTNFKDAVQPLLIKEMLYMVGNSILVNLEEIKILHKDHIVFFNDEVLYYPKTHWENLNIAWKEYLEVE